MLNKYTENDNTTIINRPFSPYKFTYKISNCTWFIEGQTGIKFRIQFYFQLSLTGSNQVIVY